MKSIKESNVCPACRYYLDFEPWIGGSPSDEICPSCGIQFGYDDSSIDDELTKEEMYRIWRKKWISDGTIWFSKSRKPPKDWDPIKQLKRVDVG